MMSGGKAGASCSYTKAATVAVKAFVSVSSVFIIDICPV